MFTSRKFWAAAISLALICAGAFLPGLPDLSLPLTDLAVLSAAYICGTALEGIPAHPPVMILHTLVRSRKFWAALTGVIVILVRSILPDFPLPDEQINAVILTLAAYIFGTGLQDGLAKESPHAA